MYAVELSELEIGGPGGHLNDHVLREAMCRERDHATVEEMSTLLRCTT